MTILSYVLAFLFAIGVLGGFTTFSSFSLQTFTLLDSGEPGRALLNVALSVILDLYGISFTEILKRLLLNTVRDAAGKERLPLPSETENEV